MDEFKDKAQKTSKNLLRNSISLQGAGRRMLGGFAVPLTTLRSSHSLRFSGLPAILSSAALVGS
ncbi:hypothetical protein OYT1_ch0254 [Ferriphaselus amnicola]|uniref:Uncharacterized protein n=1 Tax=Ferriphaselus amnicola TaxID=1188319 RepID=A0A2Z6G8Q2_9PROT|nr:hypothetical protein [Ferriphaselus amnicola]BBE49828.1 hypothetical protein OYT1_ch0254 [Ferriphaselus amnicola]